MQYLLSNEFYKSFNIFITLYRKQKILVYSKWLEIAHMRIHADFRGRKSSFPYVILLLSFIHKIWLLYTLHHLKILLVYYNDIPKKTRLIPDARSKPLHFSRLKTHVVGMIEIITAIVPHIWKLWI